MTRFKLLESLIPILSDALTVVNIGLPAQELYNLGDRANNFYMLGSMGMCSSIGLGLALTTKKLVVAIDGDGAILMNLGTLATIAHQGPNNFILLIVDNGSYGSTGNQPTYAGNKTSLAGISRKAGIANVAECSLKETAEILSSFIRQGKGGVIVSKVNPGNKQVGIIPLSAIAIRDRFMGMVKA